MQLDLYNALIFICFYTSIKESLVLAKRAFCFRYDRTSVTPVMEQTEGPMNIIASSSSMLTPVRGWV